MLLNVVVVWFCTLLASVLAQTSTTFSSSTSTTVSSAPTSTHTVAVGEYGLNFSPNQVNASIGDIIEFRFFPQNHSVARAAFGVQPCIPYEDTGPGRIGFWSGFQPIGIVSPNPPIFRLTINDTEPVFFYCSAPQACLDGMIGVINPNSTFTYQKQFDYTQNATDQFSPLEFFPPEVSSISRTTTATGAATSTATALSQPPTTTATTTPTPHPSTAKSSSLSTGAIVGIAIGGFALAVLVGAVLYMCGRQRTVKEILRQTSSMGQNNHNSYQPTSPPLGEAKYPNMTPSTISDGRFGGNNGYTGPPGNDTETYRSISPPVDERTGMIPGGGVVSPNSPGYTGVSKYYDSHEMETAHVQTGLRPYNPQDYAPTTIIPPPVGSSGPHELPVSTSRAEVTEGRPFSFAAGEDVKNGSKGY